MRKIVIFPSVALLGLAAAVIPALGASAHQPAYSLECSPAHEAIMTASFTNYEATAQAKVVVDQGTADEQVLIDGPVGPAASGTGLNWAAPNVSLDATKPHTLSVFIDSSEGGTVNGVPNSEYDVNAQLSIDACAAAVTPPPTDTPTPVTPPVVTPPVVTPPVVTPPVVTPATTVGGQLPTLAYTGASDTLPLAGGALALLLAGGTGLWIARRRTR